MTLHEISYFHALMCRLERAEELLESLQNASRPGSVVMNGLPRTANAKDKVGNIIVEIEDLKERIEFLKRELKREREKLHEFIDGISDERVRIALRLKYMCDLTWVQTADIMGDRYTDEIIKKLCYKYLST